ncbi:MAG: hypothetical protein Q9160_006032 [Pyrenula sp. 1 TL-2023]
MEYVDQQYNSLYERYKRSTEVAVQWLSEKGAGLGYAFGQRPLPQTARKNEEGQKRKHKVHEVALKDLEGLAIHIATHKPVNGVPHHIIRAFKDAIIGRKRATAWHQHISNDGHTNEVDEAHGHFTGILENVLNYLEPCVCSRQDTTKRAPTEDPVKKTQNRRQNFFQIFNTQPLIDGDEGERTANTTLLDNTPRPRYKMQYQCKLEDEDEEEDLYLFFYCLLNDLEEMRQTAKLSWMRYHRRLSSLEGAAMLSHTAAMLARQMEDSFWSKRPDGIKQKEAMHGLFHSLQQSNHSTSSLSKAANEIGVKIANMHDILTRFHSRHLSLLGHKWPTEGDLLINRDFLIPESLQGPECDMLLGLLHCCRRYFNLQKDIELFDVFTEGVKHIIFARSEQVVPIWLAFAAQLFVDSRLVLGEDYELAVEDRDFIFHRTINSCIETLEGNEKLVSEHRDSMQQRCSVLLPKNDNLEKRLELLMQENPIFTGLWALYGQVVLADIAFEANDHGLSLLPFAYLYYFLHAEGYLTGVWYDMDLIINTHGVERIFVGGLPSSAKQMVSKLELASGFSLTRWAKGPRAEWFASKPNKRRRLNSTSMPVSFMFARFMMAFPSSHKSFPLQRLELLLRSIYQGPVSSSVGKVDLDGQLQNESDLAYRLRDTPALSPSKMLSMLRRAIDYESPLLQVDYFHIERKYQPLLLRLHKIFLQQNAAARAARANDSGPVRVLDIFPDIINSMPSYQHGDRAKPTPDESEKDTRLLEALAREVNAFVAVYGREQFDFIHQMRPLYPYRTLVQLARTEGKPGKDKQVGLKPKEKLNNKEQGSFQLFPAFNDEQPSPPPQTLAELTFLEDAMFDHLDLDFSPSPQDESTDPPITTLEQYLQQQFFFGLVIATRYAACFTAGAAAVLAFESAKKEGKLRDWVRSRGFDGDWDRVGSVDAAGRGLGKDEDKDEDKNKESVPQKKQKKRTRRRR